MAYPLRDHRVYVLIDPRFRDLARALEAGFAGVPLTYWTHEPAGLHDNLPYGRLLARVQRFVGPEPIEWMNRAKFEIADATLLFGLLDIEPPGLFNAYGKPIYLGQAMVMDVRRGDDRLVLADIPVHDPALIAAHVARCDAFRNAKQKDPDAIPPVMPMASSFATVVAASDEKVVEPLAVLVSLLV